MLAQLLTKSLRWLHWLRPYEWQVLIVRRLLPQLRDLPIAQQRRIARTFDRQLMGQPGFLLSAVVASALVVVVVMVFGGNWMIRQGIQIGTPAVLVAVVVILWVVVVVGFVLSRYACIVWLWPGRALPILRRVAWDAARIRVCERCGYDLRGTSAALCSECGARRKGDESASPLPPRWDLDTLAAGARRHDEPVLQIDALNALMKIADQPGAQAVIDEVYCSPDTHDAVRRYIAKNWSIQDDAGRTS